MSKKISKIENHEKQKSLENVVFSRLLVAEGVRFELTWAEPKRFSRTLKQSDFEEL